MPRPKIEKMVCNCPKYNNFKPSGTNGKGNVSMTVEEYEVIRLIDYLGLSQEECAIQMKVSRPTVQLLYSKARKKLSEMLVNGAIIKIEGGNYKICENNECVCTNSACRCNCHQE